MTDTSNELQKIKEIEEYDRMDFRAFSNDRIQAYKLSLIKDMEDNNGN